jgi:hypothetical protein
MYTRSFRTTPCVQCRKALSYTCYKSLSEPMSKGNFVSLIRWFPTREKNSNFPFDIGSQYPSRWHNWTFPREADSSLGRNVAKCVVQFPVTCVYSLFLEVKLDNFPTRDHPRAPCALMLNIFMFLLQELQLRRGEWFGGLQHPCGSWRGCHECNSIIRDSSVVLDNTCLAETFLSQRDDRELDS